MAIADTTRRSSETHPLNERLLSRAEVEARYGITKRFLEVAIVRGDGPPFVKIGRSVRYRVSDLDAWIDARRHDPAAALERARAGRPA